MKILIGFSKTDENNGCVNAPLFSFERESRNSSRIFAIALRKGGTFYEKNVKDIVILKQFSFFHCGSCKKRQISCLYCAVTQSVKGMPESFYMQAWITNLCGIGV